jgi:lipoyl(octanoyl) transferase
VAGDVGQGGEVRGGAAGVGLEAEADVGDDWAAIGVEHDVAEVQVTVDEAGSVYRGQALRQGADQGDQLPWRERASALEEGGEGAGSDVLAEEEPLALGLADFEEPGDVWMVDGPGEFEVADELLGGGDGCFRDAFEHGVPAGGEVPEQPDGADRSGPEPTAQAVAGDVFECHAQEVARIGAGAAKVIHSGTSRPGPVDGGERSLTARLTLEGVRAIKYVEAGFGADAVDYEQAWAEQRRLHAEVAEGTGSDTVILLEHPPVYTAGKRTEPHERPVDGTPVVDADRGGKITWHGPGQLVGYPIVKLASHVYVVDYVRRLEEALIAVCAGLGVRTGRVKGRSGVWVPADERGRERKIAAIGIRVAQGVTMHGFALNCDNDLAWFDRIVPCGISDADVTTLSKELGRDVPIAEVLEPVRRNLDKLLAWEDYERTPDLDQEDDPTPAGITYGLTV